jgi:hypothetical protein
MARRLTFSRKKDMQSIIAEKPTAAFTLSLVGVVVQGVAAFVIGAAALGMFQTFGTNGLMGGMMGQYYSSGSGMMGTYSPWMMSAWGAFTWLWVPILVVTIGTGIVGVFMMDRSDVNSVRTGSVLVLVASIVAFPSAWGFIAGSVLMLVGSILGLTWTPGSQKIA